MTDKEMLLALIAKLKLTPVASDDDVFYDSRNYADEGNVVTLGRGDGYNGFYVSFEFDDEGNILKHGVSE